MKNIITILLILVIPVCAYLFLSKNSQNDIAMANENNPSLLIYTSTMCLDCQKMKEVIKEIEEDYNNKINFISINALDNNKKIQDSIKKHDIKVVPTLVFVDVNGNATNKVEGFIPKEELIIKIEEAVNE